jgi:hypothetical protein
MKQHYTHIAALIDKSGSMGPIQLDTIGGFNTFIDEQKKLPGEVSITLAQFNDKYELTYADVPLTKVAHLTTETYRPAGWTSLNDSLAKLINDTGAILAAKPEHERPSKVIIVVMTDGQENTSKEYVGQAGLKTLSDMVKHQTEKYSWQTIFLGANIDAFATAAIYGIGASNTINYTSSSTGISNAFKSVSRGVMASRASAMYGATMDSFFENERDATAVGSLHLDTSDVSSVIAKYAKDAAPETIATDDKTTTTTP